MEPKIKALMHQIESGKMKTNAARILHQIIERGEGNAIHLKSLLNIQRTTVYARLSDLEGLGLIYKSGTFNNGHDSTFKHEPNPEQQKRLRAKVDYYKFEAWKKRGLEHFNKWLTNESINALQKNLY